MTKAHSGNHVTVCASERLFTPTCKPVSNVTITTSTILRAGSVGAARKVSPNWSQEIMTCHSSNCFSIVWGQGNAPLVTFPSSCYVTPRKAWQEPMENDESLSVIYTQCKNGCQINILLFKLKLAQLASLEIRYSFEFCTGERG